MIRTLIVDDSGIVRAMLRQVMESDGNFEVVGNAVNGQNAIEQNKALSPDLIIMDINMPVMDGIEATRTIMQQEGKTPFIVAFTTEDEARIGYKCLEAGAVEIIKKPNLASMTVSDLEMFCERLKLIAGSRPSGIKKVKNIRLSESGIQNANKTDADSHLTSKYSLLVVGASTGGPVAVQTLLHDLGNDFPIPVLITQHIDLMFDRQFASWLDSTTDFSVTLAQENIIPEPGHAYLAPAETHLIVLENNNSPCGCSLSINHDPPLHFLRPAVDKLFCSAAPILKDRLLGVLLTGMGRDGAAGCKSIIDYGGKTICQNQESCVIFGMPRAAIEMNAASHVLPLEEIGSFIKSIL
ncbi:MAG: chemotaxis-specific protein-glutamate methyltransferase CheB [Treponema sp.]|nr:chemotaxis-specific protein-glutamate methyltransferase CheB [Treponema sp.]